MKYTIKLLLVAALLVFSAANAAAERIIRPTGTSLPEPILPLRDTEGEAAHLKEIANALNKGKLKECLALANECENRIIHGEIERGKTNAAITRQEFATREWLMYYVCNIPLPTIEEMLLKHQGDRFSHAYTTLGWLLRAERDIKSLKLDDERTLYKNRAHYAATLLKMLKMKKEMFEMESRGLFVREIRHYNSHHKKHWRALVESYYTNELSDDGTFPTDYRDFRNNAGLVLTAKLMLDSQLPVFESSFFRFLLRNFKDSPSSIMTYLRLAGYDNDEKIGGFFVRRKKESTGMDLTDILFDRYSKKMNFSFKTFERNAEAEKKSAERRIDGYRKYWESERIKAEAESEKLRVELEKARVEYLKAQIVIAILRPGESKLKEEVNAAWGEKIPPRLKLFLMKNKAFFQKEIVSTVHDDKKQVFLEAVWSQKEETVVAEIAKYQKIGTPDLKLYFLSIELSLFEALEAEIAKLKFSDKSDTRANMKRGVLDDMHKTIEAIRVELRAAEIAKKLMQKKPQSKPETKEPSRNTPKAREDTRL